MEVVAVGYRYRRRHNLEIQNSVLLQSLQLEYVQDKFEGFIDRERFFARLEPAQLYLFQIEHVIDEAKKQVDLTDEQKDQLSAGF